MISLLAVGVRAQGVHATVPSGEMTIPDNQWVKVGEVPDDPLGREIAQGRGAYVCFEAVNSAFLRYGGYTPTDDNSLWSFDLGRRKWENPAKVDYTWPPPTNRPGAGPWWSMAWDSKRKVVWLYGGYGLASRSHPELFRDLWQYDPALKTFRAMKSKNTYMPTFKEFDGPRIVYDSRNDLIIRAPAYAGEWSYIANRDKTWVYNPTNDEWAGRETRGSPGGASLAVPFVFDAAVGKCVYLAATGDGSGETWTYDAASNHWEKLACKENPPGRVTAGAAYDEANKQVIVYGGVSGSPQKGGYGYLYRGGGQPLHDTWALDTAKAEWKRLDVGAPVLDPWPGVGTRCGTNRVELVQSMDYDTRLGVVVVSAPVLGVWALRVRPAEAKPLAPVKLAALPPPDKPQVPGRVFPQAPPNKRLLELEPNSWVKLNGGNRVGGEEIPCAWDEETGYLLRYGGCGNTASTFASGYCQDLTAYDPATERWIALRWADD